MATFNPPFQGKTMVSLGHQIVSKQPKAIPEIYSSKISQFIFNLLEKNPKDRPSAQQALQLYFPESIIIQPSPQHVELVPIQKVETTVKKSLIYKPPETAIKAYVVDQNGNIQKKYTNQHWKWNNQNKLREYLGQRQKQPNTSKENKLPQIMHRPISASQNKVQSNPFAHEATSPIASQREQKNKSTLYETSLTISDADINLTTINLKKPSSPPQQKPQRNIERRITIKDLNL